MHYLWPSSTYVHLDLSDIIILQEVKEIFAAKI